MRAWHVGTLLMVIGFSLVLYSTTLNTPDFKDNYASPAVFIFGLVITMIGLFILTNILEHKYHSR